MATEDGTNRLTPPPDIVEDQGDGFTLLGSHLDGLQKTLSAQKERQDLRRLGSIIKGQTDLNRHVPLTGQPIVNARHLRKPP